MTPAPPQRLGGHQVVGFASGQVPPPEEVREALTRGDMEERSVLAINRFDLHVRGP
jgi:hypothetical protein